MKLHWKIALGALLVSAAALATGALYVEPALKRRFTAQLLESLGDRITLVANLLAERSGKELDPGTLEPWLVSLAAGAQTRLTIIAPDGSVLGDSWVQGKKFAHLENHATRPEVMAAVENGEGSSERYSSTIGANLLYVARRIPVAKGWAIVRAAYPLSSVEASLASVRALLWVGVGIALALAALLSIFFSRQVAAPLRALTAAADQVAGGDFGVRLHAPGGGELADLAGAFNRMAGEVGRLISEINTERGQARRILSAIQEGILLLDAGGKAVAANRAFLEMFGIAEAAVQGRAPLDLVRSDAVQKAVEAVRQGNAESESEFVWNGSKDERIIELVAAAVRESAGPAGVVLVFRDLTRTRRLEQVRKDFVANVSHELRTPLTSIRGYGETLARKLEGQETLHQFANSIVRASEGLTALVNDLLDLSRLERPDFALERTGGDLREAAAQAMDLLRERFAQKRIRLSLEAAEGVGRASFDHRLIGQVLANLLDNALKYTPEGGDVVVRVSAENGFVLADVRDTGPGIPEKDLPRLFERFYRVDKGRSRELGGTGLGLAIVKHIVARHGGSVGVENRREGGTRFWFTLPVFAALES